MYLYIEPGIAARSPLTKAAYFSLIVFGIDYLMFNLFVPLVFDYQIWPIGAFLSYADLFLRVTMDIIFVLAGVYVYEKTSSMLLEK